MSKPLIAVDLDDVIVDHYEAVVEFRNSRYGINHTTKDYISDHWGEVWGTDHAETERRAKEFAASYLIDDSSKHCRLAAEAGVHAVLFGDFAWNQVDVLPEGVTRCKDWSEVMQYFAGVTTHA